MPSDIGYTLPPVNKRPQLFSRVDVGEPKDLLKIEEDNQLESQGVELKKTQVVTKSREVLDQRFPSESQVDRFRGNTEGRNLRDVPPSTPLTRLPSRVQAFDPLTARSNALSSLSIAESAATGLSAPRVQVNNGVAGDSPRQFGVATTGASSADSSGGAPEGALPSINGSGEIAARFEKIEERIRQRALDEFEDLRPGGPESERIATESAVNESVNEAQVTDNARIQINQESALVDQRRVDQRINESVQASRALDQRVAEENSAEALVSQQVVAEVRVDSANAEAPIVREPGVPIDSQGQPLSSEEQREVQRLQRRDQEVRAHEQAHARAGGVHVRGGVQLSSSTGPDGRRYVAEGEVSVDLSAERTPEQTVSKMSQLQSASLAPANSSGADRAVASLAARLERDAQAQVSELEQLDQESQVEEQVQGDIATRQYQSERAGEVEIRENVDHIAGAQSVTPDPGFSPRSSDIDQQSLEAFDGVKPISVPEETSRPVTAPAKNLEIEEEQAPPSSPRAELHSPAYDKAIDQALKGT